MAITNYDRVGKSLELLKAGLAPFAERDVFAKLRPSDADDLISDFAAGDRMLAGKGMAAWDVAALLNFMWNKWNDVFSRTLGHAERSLVSELREHRNRWAHQGTFSSDDVYRVLDSCSRLLSADLWQVHLGEGSDEYRDPVEFFRRTYLTTSLKGLLGNAIRRLTGAGGDPVIQLQTNFGGGKTHSMLALYHLFSGINPSSLAGVDEVMKEAGR